MASVLPVRNLHIQQCAPLIGRALRARDRTLQSLVEGLHRNHSPWRGRAPPPLTSRFGRTYGRKGGFFFGIRRPEKWIAFVLYDQPTQPRRLDFPSIFCSAADVISSGPLLRRRAAAPNLPLIGASPGLCRGWRRVSRWTPRRRPVSPLGPRLSARSVPIIGSASTDSTVSPSSGRT